MARLFIAINLSDQQKNEIAAFQEKIKGYMEGIRWVKPEGLHLTLKFLGETEETRIEQIIKGLDEAVSAVNRFDIICGKSGVFPSPRKARVIWIGLRKGNEEVSNLAARVDRSLTAIGFEPEKRSYTPHLTIARARGSITGKVIPLYLEQEASFCTSPSTIDGITLYESKLSPQGATYIVRHKAFLSAETQKNFFKDNKDGSD